MGWKCSQNFLQALTPCFDRLYKHPFALQSGSVRAYLMLLVITLLALPTVIILISYGYIIKVAYKQRRQISQEGESVQMGIFSLAMKREMKAARTVAIVVGLCLGSFVPLWVILCLHSRTSSTVRPHHTTVLVLSLVGTPVGILWYTAGERSTSEEALKDFWNAIHNKLGFLMV